MKTLKPFLILTILFSSMINGFGQTHTKKGKRDILTNHKNTDLNGGQKVLANDYTFSYRTGTYTELTNATSLNNNEIWNNPEYVVPIGFDFNLFDITINTLYFVGVGGYLCNKLYRDSEVDYLVAPFETDLIDRGTLSGVSSSPISYKLEGNQGNQIVKIEWKNAGFYDEGDELGTLNDFINFQLWLYEGTNDIEIHFGPNMITNPSINYYGQTGAIIGVTSFGLTNTYLLSGNPLNPVVEDSLVFLNGTPPDGTIYKFSKNNSSSIISEHADSYNIKIYPNPLESESIIQTDKIFNDAGINIYNCFGQIVKQITNVTGNTVILKRENLTSGLYFVQLTTNNRVIATDKIIIID